MIISYVPVVEKQIFNPIEEHGISSLKSGESLKFEERFEPQTKCINKHNHPTRPFDCIRVA